MMSYTVLYYPYFKIPIIVSIAGWSLPTSPLKVIDGERWLFVYTLETIPINQKYFRLLLSFVLCPFFVKFHSYQI
jgi:hypothetical protein